MILMKNEHGKNPIPELFTDNFSLLCADHLLPFTPCKLYFQDDVQYVHDPSPQKLEYQYHV